MLAKFGLIEVSFPRAGVKVDGWGLGLGETWDLAFDADQCNQSPPAAAVATH